VFLLITHSADDISRYLNSISSRLSETGCVTWKDTPGMTIVSQRGINCATSGNCCVLLDQLYTNDGLCANGSCHDGLFGNLLQRWRSKGVNFLEDLNGSFALVLHDPEKREVLVSTDRFSTYPLWRCALDCSGIAISSDFTALAGLIHGTIDYASLWSFLTRGRPVGQHSFFNEIRAIRPATALLFRNGRLIEEVEWYKPRFEPEYGRSLSHWGKELAERLEAAVQDQMKGSSSPGLLLSGGLDSRLVASIAPKETACFTIADFNNREMRIASKVAQICGLRHDPVIRDENWYPMLLEEAAKKSIGLWHWQHMHFLPLRDMHGEWGKIDRVMLAMGFDTFLKGNQVTDPALWKRSPEIRSESATSFLVDFGACRLPIEQYYEHIMHPDVIRACRQSYRDSLAEEVEHVLPMAACIPDVWEMLQFRSIHRVPYFTNLTCLREFIPARNVIFDNKLYDLYFRIPATIRRTGNVVRAALRHQGLRLALIPDANSWLPTVFPSGVHDWARKARRGISAVRNKWYRLTESNHFKSHGSWPQVGRLWVHNDSMRRLMDDLVCDSIALPPELFNQSQIRKAWDQHKTGDADCSGVLNAIASFAIFHRECRHTGAL